MAKKESSIATANVTCNDVMETKETKKKGEQDEDDDDPFLIIKSLCNINITLHGSKPIPNDNGQRLTFTFGIVTGCTSSMSQLNIR